METVRSLLLVFVGLTFYFPFSCAWGDSKIPYEVSLAPAAGGYTMLDQTIFNRSGAAYGAFLDFMSEVKLSPSYSSSSKGHTFSITIPMTLDCGIEFGVVEVPNATPEGSVTQASGKLHVDLLRMLSLGGGVYHASVPSGPIDRHSYGGFGDVQLVTFPNSVMRPFFEARWTGVPMQGHVLMGGIKFVVDRTKK